MVSGMRSRGTLGWCRSSSGIQSLANRVNKNSSHASSSRTPRTRRARATPRVGGEEARARGRGRWRRRGREERAGEEGDGEANRLAKDGQLRCRDDEQDGEGRGGQHHQAGSERTTEASEGGEESAAWWGDPIHDRGGARGGSYLADDGQFSSEQMKLEFWLFIGRALCFIFAAIVFSVIINAPPHERVFFFDVLDCGVRRPDGVECG
ncbi:hypothetical protein EJB05_15877, partial [Eragrostis curvula]